MASPFLWPVLVPYALRAPAPVNLGVRLPILVRPNMNRNCPHCQTSLPWRLVVLRSTSIVCPNCSNTSNRTSSIKSMATQFLIAWSVIVVASLVRTELYAYILVLLAGLGAGLIAISQPLAPTGVRAIPPRKQLFILLVVSLTIALSSPIAIRVLERYIPLSLKNC